MTGISPELQQENLDDVIFIDAIKEQQAQLTEQQDELRERRARLPRQETQLEALTVENARRAGNPHDRRP